ncbi:MAG: YceI family protein [Chitinophagaceae bacterium]|nr:YceI family protein [Chitinophagaceae bacterium]
MKSFFLLLFVPFAFVTDVIKLKPADDANAVKFTVENLGFTAGGGFSGLAGSILFDENNLQASSFVVTVNAASVNTGNNLRDKHLRDADYFDAVKFPFIKIESVKIAKSVTAGYLVFFREAYY